MSQTTYYVANEIGGDRLAIIHTFIAEGSVESFVSVDTCVYGTIHNRPLIKYSAICDTRLCHGTLKSLCGQVSMQLYKEYNFIVKTLRKF